MPEHGELVGEVIVGPVKVAVRHSCARRDLYELSAPAPLPGALRDQMAALGDLKGTEALYVVDMPGSQQITVSPRSGRVVIMPRLLRTRPEQRVAALRIAELIAELLK
ncbi:MAG: hypothetical protein HUU21_08475 [Polyangiaceae bacterium]|nr:hypothetical protein [Polyangiaceae bacterium]